MPDFITYLTNERNASKSTVSSYCRDLERMFQFLDGKGIKKTDDVTPISLNSYILYLEKEGFSISTVSRNVASMKAYFHYAFGRRLIEKDPTRTIKAPHIEKRVPGVLTQEQVTRLLEQPSRNTAKGIRDKAMLELLYATGMRVSELIAVQMEDVNFSLEYVVCRDAERLRVIPLGGKAKEALKFYLKEARDRLLCGKKGNYLFVNCQGNSMSRQGFWKNLKEYARKAGIEEDITPHTFRRHIWWKTEPTFAMCRRCWATRTSRQRRSIWRWQQEKSELPIRRHIRGQINAWMSHKQKVTDSNGYRKLF